MSENWQRPDAGDEPAAEPHQPSDQQAEPRRQEEAPAWWAANPAPGTPGPPPSAPTPTSSYPTASYPTSHPTSPSGQPPQGGSAPSPWAPGWNAPPAGEHASGGTPADPPTGGGGYGGSGGGYGGGYGGGGDGGEPGPYGSSPRRRPSRRGLLGAALALTLVAGAVGGVIGAAIHGDGHGSTVVSSGLTTSSTSGGGTSPAASGTVGAAAKIILPSVVTIKETSQTESGTGSGVIIRSDGYILTNNHVVSAAADGGSVSVTLPSGKTVSAKIVGRDPTSDLAVVKVGQTGLKAATFGNSDALQVGELVVAVGSPLGLSDTVTSGIVSALHRPVSTGDSSVSDTQAVLDAVQTDAPINPGNSGGPLVNSRGEVVGINSAIASVGGSGGGFGQQEQQSGNIGVGFAIPSTAAEKVANQLISTGTATHAYIGVSAATVGDTSSSDADDGDGASVQSLVANGPAAKAGLQQGDVIVKVDDRAITGVDGLVAAVRSHDIGSTVTVTYTRNGQTHTAKVTLAQAPASS